MFTRSGAFALLIDAVKPRLLRYFTGLLYFQIHTAASLVCAQCVTQSELSRLPCGFMKTKGTCNYGLTAHICDG